LWGARRQRLDSARLFRVRNAIYNAQGSARVARFGEDIARGICAAASWRQAVNDSARVVVTRKDPPLPPAVADRYYFSLPDPFKPLLDLWQLGYTLDAITADAVVLVAPEVADDGGRGRPRRA
jgi:hypothetical protein